MFNLDGLLPFILICGLGLGLLVIGIPAYLLGCHHGKLEVYDDALKHKVLDIRYDSQYGTKQYIWKEIK
jgi:hypothetical protein